MHFVGKVAVMPVEKPTTDDEVNTCNTEFANAEFATQSLQQTDLQNEISKTKNSNNVEEPFNNNTSQHFSAKGP